MATLKDRAPKVTKLKEIKVVKGGDLIRQDLWPGKKSLPHPQGWSEEKVVKTQQENGHLQARTAVSSEPRLAGDWMLEL